MMLLRARSLAMGYSGARARGRRRRCSPCSTPASRPSCASTARSAPAATSPRWPRRRSCCSARARRAWPTARWSTGRPRSPTPASRRSTLRAKEGLALINGTDGMLGMLVLALADLDVLLRVADIAAAMSTEALLGTDRAFAEDLVAMRPQVGQAVERGEPAAPARRLADRRQPPLRRRPRAGRLLAALHAAGPRRRPATPSSTPGRSPTASWCRSSTTRSCCPTAGSSRAATSTARRSPPSPTSSPSRSPTSGRSASGAPTACSTAPARTACRRSSSPDAGVNSGLMIGQYTPGGDGRREPPARRAGEHRHAADERDAGGPRVARLVGGAQAARRRWPTWPASSPSSSSPARGASQLRRPLEPAAATGAVADAVAAAAGGPGPDQWLAPAPGRCRAARRRRLDRRRRRRRARRAAALTQPPSVRVGDRGGARR